MATPAARTLQKRYTAGSCILDVELQLSALSQWYPQPLAQDLQFKLWMNNSEAEANQQNPPASGAALEGNSLSDAELAANARLVAEGDRTALLSLSQAISQKVRELLAIAHLNYPNSSSSAERSRPVALSSTQQLPGLQLASPLSYLQLCDLSSVLHQCEQSTPALPVALAAQPAIQPAAVQSAAQSAAANSLPTVTPALPARENSAPPRRNNIIPFAAMRRRPQLWASSAAAALLAVGLSTTLWPSLQFGRNSGPNSAPQSTTTAKLEESTESNADNSAATGDVARAPNAAPGTSGTSNTRKAPAADSDVPPSSTDTRASVPSPAAPSRSAEQAAPPREQATEEDRSTTAKLPSSTPNAPAPNPAVTAPSAAPSAPSEASPQRQPAEQQPNSVDETTQNGPESFSTANGRDESALSAARQAEPSGESLRGQASDQASDQALVQQSSVTIGQVQGYFQSKWLGSAQSETLSYSVQLSETGEVVSFVGLSSAAENYRDRLLSANEPLVFPGARSPDAPASSLALNLRVDLLPDGQVQVYEF